MQAMTQCHLHSFSSINAFVSSCYECAFKELHRGWSASGNDLVLLVFSFWDGSDMPQEITEWEHAHSEVTYSAVSQWWLEMWSTRTAWPSVLLNIQQGSNRQVGNALFNLSQCKLILLWLQRTCKPGGYKNINTWTSLWDGTHLFWSRHLFLCVYIARSCIKNVT